MPRAATRVRREPPLIVRAASGSDRSAVLAINELATPGVTALDAADLEDLAGVASLFLVAEMGGTVAGYVLALAPEDDGDWEEFLWFRSRVPACLYVDQVAVHPGFRRRGVADGLYRAAFATAATRGIPRLACEINLEPPNPVSFAFHRGMGFREVGRLRVSDGRLVSMQVCDHPSRP